MNERGQIVIPEDIRKDMDIGNATTLVIIEKEGEIIIRKESDVFESISEDKFWEAISRESLKRAWSKEDEVWDSIARKDMNG